jgi:hypothetical protein
MLKKSKSEADLLKFKMIKLIFIIILIVISNQLFAQSKKEQIELLTFQMDSLKKLNETLINDQIEIINDFQSKLYTLENKNRQLSEHDSLLRIDLFMLRLNYDSLIKYQENMYCSNLKHGILKNLVGQFQLDHIEGVQGTNTMFDYYMKNGEWYSFYSSIVGGMRDGSEEKLKLYENNILESLKIEIFEDLTIKLLEGSKILLEIPFIESGMDFKISNTESELPERFLELTKKTYFKDNNLMILADDSIDLSNFFVGLSLDVIYSDNLLLIYSLKDGEFILEIFSSEFSESIALTFKAVNV